MWSSPASWRRGRSLGCGTNGRRLTAGEDRSRRVAREDLVTFINACFSCTGQREFYGDAKGQAVSIDFLHEYTAGNYRRSTLVGGSDGWPRLPPEV